MTLFKRLKTLIFALSTAISLWTAQAHAAGTLPLAMAQQIDINGKPLAGCQVTFFVAGTVGTLQNNYADFGLTTPQANPLSCDQAGRVPMFWLADGLIQVRLTDSFGLQVIDTTMQVLGPSSGGGGGGSTVDPTTIASTGDLKWRLDKTQVAGWVRINGLTIGSATSGASERANADTQALYIYIWNTYSQPSGNTNCPVVGGLGANALADFSANKQITLSDTRARTVMGFDDMGNSAAGGYAGVPFTFGNATFAGSFAGANSTTLTLAQLPSITSTGANTITVSGSNSFSASGSNTITASNASQAISVTGAQSHSIFIDGTMGVGPNTGATNQPINGSFAGAGGLTFAGSNNISVSGTNTINVAGSVSITSSAANTINVTSSGTLGQAFPSVPRFLLGTLYWKL
jgi:hypothetical protein